MIGVGCPGTPPKSIARLMLRVDPTENAPPADSRITRSPSLVAWDTAVGRVHGVAEVQAVPDPWCCAYRSVADAAAGAAAQTAMAIARQPAPLRTFTLTATGTY
jgi:hypothetical protein